MVDCPQLIIKQWDTWMFFFNLLFDDKVDTTNCVVPLYLLILLSNTRPVIIGMHVRKFLL